MAGTTLAPVVAGNTVLLKPAEDTPYIAYKLMEILEHNRKREVPRWNCNTCTN
jgi:acyl-CoA reductase-like NAD-dependent aldehyde dehydrogenase